MGTAAFYLALLALLILLGLGYQAEQKHQDDKNYPCIVEWHDPGETDQYCDEDDLAPLCDPQRGC